MLISKRQQRQTANGNADNHINKKQVVLSREARLSNRTESEDHSARARITLNSEH